MMRVGPMIRAWRAKHDLSVRDTAPRIGVSIATLSRIERGDQIDAETQLKLIVFLFRPDDTLLGTINPPSQKENK